MQLDETTPHDIHENVSQPHVSVRATKNNVHAASKLQIQLQLIVLTVYPTLTNPSIYIQNI